MDTLGMAGEDAACDYLTDHRWDIIERNWRCPHGELDIVARRDNVLAFVEVKTRRSTAYGGAVSAVSAQKYLRLRRLAGAYLAEHHHAGDVRVDVIAVTGDLPDFTLVHLEDVRL